MFTSKRLFWATSLIAILVLLLGACSASESVAVNDGDHEAVVDHDEESETSVHRESEDEHGHDETAHVEAHEQGHGHDLTSHEPIEGAEEIRVVATEWGFEPSTIHLHEGEAANITLVNEGALEHEIELEAFDFHIHAEPGAIVTAGLVPETTGEFEFACFVTGHYENGMVGGVAVEHAH